MLKRLMRKYNKIRFFNAKSSGFATAFIFFEKFFEFMKKTLDFYVNQAYNTK